MGDVDGVIGRVPAQARVVPTERDKTIRSERISPQLQKLNLEMVSFLTLFSRLSRQTAVRFCRSVNRSREGKAGYVPVTAHTFLQTIQGEADAD